MNMFKWLPFADLLLKKLMTVVIADLVAMQLNLKKKKEFLQSLSWWQVLQAHLL